MVEQAMRRRDAARHRMNGTAPHQKQIRRRQYRQRHTGMGQFPSDRLKRGMIERRQFGDMADRHAPSPAPALSLAANFVEMHPGGIEIEIEMKIDIEIIALRQVEDSRDLAV